MAEAAPSDPTGTERSPSHGSAAGGLKPARFWEPPDTTELEAVLPGYSVLALIGSGGMGAVYQAKQLSLGRLVALKVISPDHAQHAPDFTSSFNREAAALAKLSHPNIAHLFDCGRTRDGQLFIATEFVPGRDLGELLAGKQALQVKGALSMASSICVALEHAHERGVLHCDLKPANVMVDASGRVKVTDFALARILQAAVTGSRQESSLLGTPRFTAPEVLTPGAPIDARADVFSVGVLLYQMLTGEVPRGAVSPPSEFAPEIDARFDAIVAGAMAEDPSERYPDAASLLRALEELRSALEQEEAAITTEPVIARKPALPAPVVDHAWPAESFEEPLYEAESPLQKEPRPSLAPWLATLVVVGIAAFWGWQQWKHPAEAGHSSVASSATPTPPPAPKPPLPAALAVPTPAQEPANPLAIAPAVAEAAPSFPVLAPVPPVAPMAEPVVAPEELAETQRRLAQIQADFDAGIKQWQAGQDVKFNQLDGRYLVAIRNAISAMRNSRRLADQSALQEEERLLVSRTPLPLLDPRASPERVRLREAYDQEVRKIAIAGAETKSELYDRRLGSLFAYQSILKQTNKGAAADVVAAILERSMAERDEVRASLKVAPSPP